MRPALAPIVFALILFLIFALFFLNIVTVSFTRLGLRPEQISLIFISIIIGGYINIPIARRKVVVTEKRRFPSPFFYYPPRVAEQVIYVNVGGALIPIALSIYLLSRVPLAPAIIATLLMTVLSKAIARPMPGVGITMPVLIPPIVSALLALLLARENPAPVAYISGVLGTLIGADLLNLGRIKDIGGLSISIGGAGVFDGVFLVGVIAVLLT